MDKTDYLLSSPKNAERLLEAIRELEAGGGEEHDLIDAPAGDAVSGDKQPD